MRENETRSHITICYRGTIAAFIQEGLEVVGRDLHIEAAVVSACPLGFVKQTAGYHV